MARPRKLRILSSDEEDDAEQQQPPPATAAPTTRTTRTSTSRTTRTTSGLSSRSQSTLNPNGTASHASTSTTSAATSATGSSKSKPKTSRTKSAASVVSPRKSTNTRTLSASSQSNKSAPPISSFFTTASTQPAAAKKGSKTGGLTQAQLAELIHEDEELDGIESSSSEDDDRRKRRKHVVIPIISSEPDELPRKVSSFKRAVSSSTTAAATSAPASSRTQSKDTTEELRESRTWAEKYAPSSAAGLAIHKRKIDDVKSWLHNVFVGTSSKRLLVLHGPSGSGKTATISALANDMDFDVLKWENPSQIDMSGDAIFESLNSRFEEFMGRGTGYGTLMLTSASSSRPQKDDAPPKKVEEVKDPSRRRVILLEDLPNIFSSSSSASSAMMSFREAIHTFLATPQDPGSVPSPCVLIISENLTTQSNSTSITPHRLLGPQLLNHRQATSIQFNKIAPTIIQKALEKVVEVESRRMGLKELPSDGLLAGIGACGDIRSAINTLEFMLVGKGNGFRQGQAVPKAKKKGRGMKGVGEPSESEKTTLELITQRESSLGIFHAVGKICYNKRYDPSEPTELPPEILPDPAAHLSSFKRPPSLVDIKTLIDTAGVDLETFVSGIHENYLHSCAGPSFPEHFESCIENLSDSDILSYNVSPGGRNQVDDNLRQGELAFQVAVRGTLMGLPAKVKRESTRNNMYYPMSMRLWRDKEIVEGFIKLFVANGIKDFGGAKIPGGMADLDGLLEYFPYVHRINKARVRNMPRTTSNSLFTRTPAMKNLEKVVLFRGVGEQSEAVVEDLEEDEEDAPENLEFGEEDEMGNVKVKRKIRRQKESGGGQYGSRFKKRGDGMGGVGVVGIGDDGKGGATGAGDGDGAMEDGLKDLVIEGDDIEDDDDW